MPPLHQPNNSFVEEDFHDDENDHFMPLVDRRWSDASDVSAYCMQADEQELRKHPHRVLQPKKVAVIVSGDGDARSKNAMICAATLQQDGHHVTLFEERPVSDLTIDEVGEHPDFSRDDYHATNSSLSYYETCAIYFGLTLNTQTKVVEMKKKLGGWVLSCSNHNAFPGHERNEYFDFVVIGTESPRSQKVKIVAASRFYQQLLLPCVMTIVWVLAKVLEFHFAFVSRKSVTTNKDPESATLLYRRMIYPDSRRVAFFEHSSASTAYLASIWLSTMLYDEMNLPDVLPQNKHQRASWLTFNDLLMQDLGLNSQRKENVWQEFFEPYTCHDYRGIVNDVQERRRISEEEGWAVPLIPRSTDL